MLDFVNFEYEIKFDIDVKFKDVNNATRREQI